MTVEVWEYKVITPRQLTLAPGDGVAEMARSRLDDLGGDGWELVGQVAIDDTTSILVFKRPRGTRPRW